ncbi:MAG TPA: RNA polymerase sigma factor [Candidatus Sulfotelmatobacter sp.]|nr:RNA polymerase sigma factor [Candidatus Sulfotelmatobacter sp.]
MPTGTGEADPGIDADGPAAWPPDPLAARLASDLDGAFPALVTAHADLVYAVAMRSTRDAMAAEDLAQDAFVRAYRALERYPAQRVRDLHLRAWLSRITLNLARNRARDRRARPAEAPLEAIAFDAADAAPRPDEAVLRRESAAAWQARLAALPPAYAMAVELRHVHGLSYAEMAEALGRPLNTAKVHVHRGLALLRTAYEKEIQS